MRTVRMVLTAAIVGILIGLWSLPTSAYRIRGRLDVDSVMVYKTLYLGTTTYSGLSGSTRAIIYCTDCTLAAPTAAGGSGAVVARENGVWNALRSGGGGSGETNTASNHGAATGTIFMGKSGVDLQFKTLAAGTGLSIANGDSVVTVSLTGIPTFITGSGTLDFDLTSVATQDLTITVTGAAVGDPVALGIPVGTANVIYFAWVSATNTVTVRAIRTCDSTPNPASGTFKVTVVQ